MDNAEVRLPRSPLEQTTPIDERAEAFRSGAALQRLRWIRRALVLGDAVSVVTAFTLVLLVAPVKTPASLAPMLTLAAGPVLWVAVFSAFGLYGWNGLSRPSVFEEGRDIVGAVATGGLAIIVLTAWWDPAPSHVWLVALIVLALALELLTRWSLRRVVRHERNAGRLALRTLLVGANEEARWLYRQLSVDRGWFEPIGSIGTRAAGDTLEGLPVAGTIDHLDDAIRQTGTECVFIATTAVSPEDVLEISRACRRSAIEMRLSANVTDILSSRLSVASADGVTAIVFRPVRPTPAQQTAKRIVDVIVGSLALVVTIPLLAVIALAIRLTSRGPVFFRQARITKDGRIFTILKFRTMVLDAERALDRTVIDLTQPFFKIERDPRLTHVGRVLRSFSLDELPQLWNVLRGDMSLVGPRPLPAEQVAANPAFLAPRHEVRAGLTGLWQISGRSELDSAEALRLDRFYIENWSLSLDVYIMAKTLLTVFTRRGAY